MQDREAFYIKLKSELEATTKFPSEYLYKFIVPTTEDQEQQVKNVFVDTKAKISLRASKTGKFVSLSVRIILKSAEEVISYYQRVEKIKGIISL